MFRRPIPVRRFLSLSLALFFVITFVSRRAANADAIDKETAELVAKMLPQYHISRHDVDDQISGKLMDRFLKDLDPQKLYFTQEQINDFNQYRTVLDDQLKVGNVSFAYRVFEVYKNAVNAQTEVAHKWIDTEHDFTLDEVLSTDTEHTAWAKSQEELTDRWRKRVKFDLLKAKLDKVEITKAREILHKRYRNVKRAIGQMKDIDKLEAYLTALTSCYDPHSSYMSPFSWEDFEIQMKLSLDGIGAALKSDDGNTVVASIVPDGAAAKDGQIKVGDHVVGVGQEAGEIDEVFDMKLSDVVRRIRGKAGTKVRLQIQHENSTETHLITLTRKKIELNESGVKGEIIDGSRVGRSGKIGVLNLPSFYRDFEGASEGGKFKSAAVDSEAVLQRFNAANVDAVIVDLRNDGGGSLTEAVEISGLFIDQGPVVQVKQGTKVNQLNDEIPGAICNKPLVVVCNRLSASASEIFAGAMKDYHRAIIVGDTTTHGKGTVQNLMDVTPKQPFKLFGKSADRGKLKLTIQQFYRVNGDSTQNLGVPSDIVLPSIIDHGEQGESFMENALPFDHIQQAAHHENRQFVTANLLADLQKKSEQRVAADPDFKRVEGVIARYLDRKNRKQVTLNEDKFRQERQEEEKLKSEKEKAKDKRAEDPDAEEEKPDDPNKPVFPKEFYNDELLNVTLDYVTGYNTLKTARR